MFKLPFYKKRHNKVRKKITKIFEKIVYVKKYYI